MPSKSQGDLIREQGEEIVKLGQRLDHIQRDLDKFERAGLDAKNSHQDLDKQLTVLLKDVSRLEKRWEDLTSRRWDFWKILLTVILSTLLGFAAGLLGKSLDRSVPPSQSPPRR